MGTTAAKDFLFVSPHPDDIALSLGAMCGVRETGRSCRLVTVFSRTDFVAPEVPRDERTATKLRKAEDIAFAEAFRMTRVDLDFADFPLRTGLPVDTCTSAPVDATAMVLDALLSLDVSPSTLVFAPAGLGHHVDHVAVRDATKEFAQRRELPLVFYSEMPYGIRQDVPRLANRQLITGDGEAWFRAVKCYPSQVRLVRETLRLAGPDGVPILASCLSSSLELAPPAPSPTSPLPLGALLAEQFSLLRELRDSVHVVARRTPPTRSKIRVLFLVHLIEAWDSCHDVVSAMLASDDFEPMVMSIPRHFPGDAGLGHEEEVHLGLERAGVAHLRMTGPGAECLQIIKSLAPDIIFRQSQWDPDIAPELGTEHLGFARTCLIPYETMNIIRNNPLDVTANSAIDCPCHRNAWIVFCANDLVLDMARKDGALGGSQFRVVGHPKADRVRAATPSWPITSAGPRPRARRVVWSAHHSIGNGWTNFGAFHLMADGMLAWAREERGTDFVFLPHPALIPLSRSPSSPIAAAALEYWLSAWNSLPNTGFSDDGQYMSILAASDLLVTDGLSLLVEYQLLERPVVFFERAEHRPFNEIGDLVRLGVHAVTTLPELRACVADLLSGPDPLRSTQRQLMQRLFGDSGSASRILGTLRETLKAETARSATPAPEGCWEIGGLPTGGCDEPSADDLRRVLARP
jgi:LmbE family N-acetylglucosaminyl deacetylase